MFLFLLCFSYVIQESSSKFTIYKNFETYKTISEPIAAIFGGNILASVENSLLYFRSWEEGRFIRRIDVDPKQLYWSDSGNFLVISTQKDGFFVLKYNSDAVTAYFEQDIPIPLDGIEESFEVLCELDDDIISGFWIGDCFVFTTSSNRLDYFVGNHTYPISHLECSLYIIGYLPKNERLYLADKVFYSFIYLLI